MSFLFDGLQIFTPYLKEDDSDKDETFLNVTFLDNSTKSMRICKKATGEKLRQRVMEYLNIIDSEYFGLMIKTKSNKKEKGLLKESHEKNNYSDWEWINEKKKVYQMIPKNAHGLCVLLRVRFFPIQPSKVLDCFSRRLIFLDIAEKVKYGVWDFEKQSKDEVIEFIFLATKAFNPEPITCNNTQQFIKISEDCGRILMTKKEISVDEILRESITLENSYGKANRYYENSSRLSSNTNKDTYVLDFLKKIVKIEDYGKFIFSDIKNKADKIKKLIVSPHGIFIENDNQENLIFKNWENIKNVERKGNIVKIIVAKDSIDGDKSYCVDFKKRLVDAKKLHIVSSDYHKQAYEYSQKSAEGEERMKREILKSRHVSMSSNTSFSSNFSFQITSKDSIRSSIIGKLASIKKRFSSNGTGSFKLRSTPFSNLSQNVNSTNDSGIFNDSLAANFPDVMKLSNSTIDDNSKRYAFSK
uniref:FERM domain-containing protein n=1 Tax=Parastrongyloides trichosuri TaxID=131310 RepID=A0A0N4ZZ35_PARTI